MCPTWVWTQLVKEVEKDATALRMVEAVVPLERIARADEVGDTVAFFCSPLSTYINGVPITIDAGVTLGARMN